MLGLIAIIGLALDSAYVYLIKQQLQVGADAAALAGAAKVRFNQAQAVTETVNTALQNKAGNRNTGTIHLTAATDVAVGHFDRTAHVFTPGAPYDAVEVYTRRETGSVDGPLPLIFGPIVATILGQTGYNYAEVRSHAIAMSGGTLSAGIVLLDPTRESSFGVNGNPTINVNGGAIQVNSNDPQAVRTVGSALIVNATELRINGGISYTGSPTLPTKTYTGTTPVPDPLAWLPVPTKGADLGSIDVSSDVTVTANPGYYSGGIRQTKGTLILNPGIYIVGSPGLHILGGDFSALGVMFYITSNAAGTYGDQPFEMDAQSKHTYTITPPTSGTYKDVAIFVDRSWPYSDKSKLNGNDGVHIEGTLYMPSVGLYLQGGCNYVCNQLIAATFDAGGNDTFTIQYDGRNPVTINNVFLVD